MGTDVLRVESNERVDITDFEFVAQNDAQQRQIFEQFMTDPNKTQKWVVSGFEMSNPSASNLQVTKGKAIFARREGGEIFYGVLTSEGDVSKTVDLTSYSPGTYGIYVRFEYIPGENQGRIFWNSAGDGSEYSQSINIRLLARWNLRIEATSPGNEWMKLGEVAQATMAITDERNFYFEGKVDDSYESGWSSQGGGIANDRNADRATYGVGDLQTALSALRQCIEDVKGRGLRRWYEQGIGGMNVGFNADPTEDRLAVGDTNMFFQLSGADSILQFDTNDKFTFDRTAGTLNFNIGATNVFDANTLEFKFNVALWAQDSGANDARLFIYNEDAPTDKANWAWTVQDDGYLRLRVADDDGTIQALTAGAVEFSRLGSGSDNFEKINMRSDNGFSLTLHHAGQQRLGWNISNQELTTIAVNDAGTVTTDLWMTHYDSGESSWAVQSIAAHHQLRETYPVSDNNFELGRTTERWSDIHSAKITVSTGASLGCSTLEPIATTSSYTLGTSGYNWYRAYIDRLNLGTAVTQGIESDFLPSIDTSYDIGSASRRFGQGYFETIVRLHDDINTNTVELQMGVGLTENDRKWQIEAHETFKLQTLDSTWASPIDVFSITRSGGTPSEVLFNLDLRPDVDRQHTVGTSSNIFQSMWSNLYYLRGPSPNYPSLRAHTSAFTDDWYFQFKFSGPDVRLTTTNSSYVDQKILLEFNLNSADETLVVATTLAGQNIVFPDINTATPLTAGDAKVKTEQGIDTEDFLVLLIGDDYGGSPTTIYVPYWTAANW